MTSASGAPSSACRHLLPDGEKTDRNHREVNVSKRLKGKTELARRLRKQETDTERLLWSELRHRRLNRFKFVRQIPLGPFVVDLLCREKKLIVELDGSQHAANEADERRTAWLNAQGYSVLRFWNQDIFKERQAVLETILAVLEGPD